MAIEKSTILLHHPNHTNHVKPNQLGLLKYSPTQAFWIIHATSKAYTNNGTIYTVFNVFTTALNSEHSIGVI